MRKYKVWGGLTVHRGKQIRTVVATKTKKKAIEIIRQINYIGYSYFNDYWYETGNEKELKLALAKPETIIYMEVV